MDTKTYVLIHGRLPHTDKTLQAYVEHIVYGSPAVTVFPVDGHFVALCEYDEHEHGAAHTFQRMGSFSFGSQLTYDRLVALREVGSWAYHYARCAAGTSLEIPA